MIKNFNISKFKAYCLVVEVSHVCTILNYILLTIPANTTLCHVCCHFPDIYVKHHSIPATIPYQQNTDRLSKDKARREKPKQSKQTRLMSRSENQNKHHSLACSSRSRSRAGNLPSIPKTRGFPFSTLRD